MAKENQNWQVFVLILKDIANQKNITQEQIALEIGVKQSVISRFFTLNHCPSMELFINIAKAIKVNFFFEDREDKSELTQAFERAMEELGRRANKLPRN